MLSAPGALHMCFNFGKSGSAHSTIKRDPGRRMARSSKKTKLPTSKIDGFATCEAGVTVRESTFSHDTCNNLYVGGG